MKAGARRGAQGKGRATAGQRVGQQGTPHLDASRIWMSSAEESKLETAALTSFSLLLIAKLGGARFVLDKLYKYELISAIFCRSCASTAGTTAPVVQG